MSDSLPPPLENISVILVRTSSPGNVGSIARIMKNLNFDRLKLVDVKGRHEEQCRRLAGKAFPLVEKAEAFDSLAEAVAGEQILVATTSNRERRVRAECLTPRQAAREILEYASANRVGLLFGPEKSGLNQAQIARCRFLVSIPANPEYPVLNVSKAATILLYEISRASTPDSPPTPRLVNTSTREELYADLRGALQAIGFLSCSNPNHIMATVQGIFDRADLTERDMRILRGIVSQLDWYIREGSSREPDDILKP